MSIQKGKNVLNFQFCVMNGLYPQKENYGDSCCLSMTQQALKLLISGVPAAFSTVRRSADA